MKSKNLLIVVLALFLSIGFAVHAQDNRTLTVFAAASLTDAFEEIALAFEADNPGVEVVFNFTGSSDLATQLSEGAPADVFASANTRQLLNAREAGRITGQVRIFARNHLVLIVPADNPAAVQGLADLANDGVLLVIAAPDVPVRDYTDTMLERLAADPGYGEAYRDAVLANVVSEEQNVRQVSAKVALGEADAGIVYASDVTPDLVDDVIVFPIEDAFNTIAIYPMAVTNDAAEPELAQAFINAVFACEGQAVLVKWGFISARPLTCGLR